VNANSGWVIVTGGVWATAEAAKKATEAKKDFNIFLFISFCFILSSFFA